MNQRNQGSLPRRLVPRCLALLGGTTTWGDCWLALRYLAQPRRLLQGSKIQEYERAFAQLVGVRYAYSFSSARVGFYGLLRALGVGPGDEVLLQVPTHVVVANAIRYTGARPVYVECTLDDYNIDLADAERRITPRTKVLLLQHTFGIPVDLDAALALARRRGLEVIEDCVHALGSNYDGKPVGSFGRAAFFSTEETKTISTTMGGMVVTNDQALAARMREFQETCPWPSRLLTARYLVKLVVYHVLTYPPLHGFARRAYDYVGRRNPLPRPTTNEERQGKRPARYEQRLSNAQAALGLRQLRRLKTILAHRARIAQAYQAKLSEQGFATVRVAAAAQPAFVRFPVWVQDRPAVLRAAAPYAVLGTWFTSVLEEADSPASGGYEVGSCPKAELLAQHLVNLPTHPRVLEQDIPTLTSILGPANPTARTA